MNLIINAPDSANGNENGRYACSVRRDGRGWGTVFLALPPLRTRGATRNSHAHYPAARWGHRALPPLRTREVRTARAPWYGAAALPQVRVTGRRALRGYRGRTETPPAKLSACATAITPAWCDAKFARALPCGAMGTSRPTAITPAWCARALYPNAVGSPKSSAAGGNAQSGVCVGRFHGKKNNRVVLKYGILRVP